MTAYTPIALCPSTEVQDQGIAHMFDVVVYDEIVPAFVIRHDGQVRSYLNRCAHIFTAMDWQHGQFWDADKQFIVCSIHGAMYQPQDGYCFAGPCAGAKLVALTVHESEGQIWWTPSERIQPVVF